jgi:hypothetical protein
MFLVDLVPLHQTSGKYKLVFDFLDFNFHFPKVGKRKLVNLDKLENEL